MTTRAVFVQALSDRKKADSADPSNLGSRMRRLRVDRDVTLETLAKLTGFSKGYLSRIENNKKTPPLGTLARVADALETSLVHLLSPAGSASRDDPPFVSLVRADDRKDVIRGASEFGYDYVSLTNNGTAQHMQPLLFTFPTEIEKYVFFEHRGEEFMFILSGRVEWQIGHERHMLEPGDSLHFDARLPHRGRSIDGEAKAIVVLYAPDPETSPRQ